MAVGIGRRVIWTHTFGERCVDADDSRPAGRIRVDNGPRLRSETGEGTQNSTLGYSAEHRELQIGAGVFENVLPEVHYYEVSGTNVIRSWFNYRKPNKGTPAVGFPRADHPGRMAPRVGYRASRHPQRSHRARCAWSRNRPSCWRRSSMDRRPPSPTSPTRECSPYRPRRRKPPKSPRRRKRAKRPSSDTRRTTAPPLDPAQRRTGLGSRPRWAAQPEAARTGVREFRKMEF